MNEVLIKALHDFIVIALGATKNKLTQKEAEDKQTVILDGCKNAFTEKFTLDMFKKIVDKVKEDIASKYYNQDKESQIIKLITDYLVDNEISDLDKANSKVSSIWTYILDKEESFRVDKLEFNLKEIYNVEINTFIESALEIAKVKIENNKLQKELKKGQEESAKREEENYKKLNQSVEADVNVELTNDTLSERSMLYTELLLNAPLINRVMNLVALLAYDDYPEEDKDAICYTIAGNTEFLKVFLSYDFVNIHLSTLYRQIKENSNYLDNLKQQGYEGLVGLVSKSSLEKATQYIMYTIASYMLSIEPIPKGFAQIRNAVTTKLVNFDTKRQDYTVKRQERQELVFGTTDAANVDPTLQLIDEAAFQKAQQEREKAEALYGGPEAYNRHIKEQNEKYKIKKLTSLVGAEIEKAENCHNKPDYEDVKYDIRGVLQDILDFYRRIFDLTIKMQRFSGIFMFKDSNDSNSECGVMELIIDSHGEAKLRTIYRKASGLSKWLRDDYEYPIRDTLKVARHNQVPTLENIMVHKYNYYPVFIARYAMGYVDGVRHGDFKTFMKEVEVDLENRLYKIYKDTVEINGEIFKGEDLFDFSHPNKVDLIGAFVNSIIFLTGNSKENFDSAQIRCVSAYPHSEEATYYTKYETTGTSTKGLSDAASVRYLEVNNSFASNVIDITYIKDKNAFYNTISWAYQELGKVYSSGVIPQVGRGESVIIGQELSGNLVEFSLGNESAFTTSIYAGSRSGKGVTTLSILGAIMASKIGVCYLDCKPDMVNCFWEMEDKLAINGLVGKTYGYDMRANTPRLGRTILKGFQEAVPKSSKLYSVSLAEALFIVKQIQMVVLTGMWKQKLENAETIVWVFDEINNMVSMLESGFSVLLGVLRSKDASAEDKVLADRIFKYWAGVQKAIGSGSADTWGKCGYKFLCIGQKPQDIMYDKGQPSPNLPEKLSDLNSTMGSDILKIIAMATENKYILGRGVNITGGFGTAAFHSDKTRSAEEKEALENYRYFLMRDSRKVTVTAGEKKETVIFKPFLTLNFDDVLQGCWTGGIGKSTGGFNSSKMGTPEETSMLIAYKKAMNSAFGPNTEMSDAVLQDNRNGKGVIDEGTGFYGLLKTYLNGDDKEVLSTAIKPYVYFTKYFMDMDLLGENSMYGHKTLEDFLYDFSEGPMKLTELSCWKDEHDAWLARKGATAASGEGDGEEGSSLGNADFSIGGPSETVKKQEQVVTTTQDTAKLELEKEKANILNAVKQQQDRALIILQEVQGYGNSLDIAVIDKQLQNIKSYSNEVTNIVKSLANLVSKNGLDFDTTLNGVNSAAVVLGSKQKELLGLREQVVNTQELEQQQQSKTEIEQELLQSLEQQQPIVEDINVDEAATELASASDTAFTPDETVDIDLRSYYVDADYMKNVNKTLTEFEGIYRKCLNTKNELSKQILQNGVKGEEITKLLATIASLRQNIEDTLTPVYEKKEKLEEAINLIYEDVDNGDFEKADKLETYKANFDDLKDISNLKSGIDTLENDVLELEQINEVMLGILTTYNAGKQLVNKINQVINTSKINLNHSLVERDLQSLSSEIEELKLGSNQLLKNDGDTLPLTVQLKIDELDNAYKDIQNKLAQIQQAQQVNAEQQRKQEEDAQNLLRQADDKLQQDIAEQAQTIEDMESLADSSDSAGLGGQAQSQMAGGQAQSQMIGGQGQSQMVGSQGQDTGQQVTGAQQGVQTATGNQVQSQNQDDFIFDDSTGVVDMTQGPSMMAQPGQTQRVQADPSVKLQAGMSEYATRVMPNGSAVSKAANYLEDAIRESLPDLEEGRRRTSSIGFVDRAFVKKNLKDRYKLLVRVIGEGVGWVDVTRLDMLADRFVVNNQFTIPVQSLGDDGYNIYEIIDYADLLFKRAIRLKYLIIDQEVAENMIAECGGDVFELLFTNIQTMQVIQFGNTKITRNNRDKSIEMAIKAEVDRASNKSKAKNAMAENLFASGQLKKTQQNMSIANKVLRRAAKTGGKVGNTKGIMQAKRFLNLTPMQAVTSAVAGVFIGVIGLFSRAR